MIETSALYLGYIVMFIGAIIVVCCLIICTAYMVNRSIRWVLDCYGGWETFCEFRDWYHNIKDK